MFSLFTLSDKLLFVAAFLSLIFSKITFLSGNVQEAIFVGIWVPSILGFGIYLKLLAWACLEKVDTESGGFDM